MNEQLAFGSGRVAGRRDALPGPAALLDAPLEGVAEVAEVAAARAKAHDRRDWAFLALLAFTALLYFRPQDTIRPLGALHLAEVCAILGLVSLGIGRLARNLPVSRLTPELMGVLALGAVMLATAPFSIWTGGAIGVFTDLYLKIILIFLLMVNTVTSPARIERVSWLIVVASGYIGFRAVLDYARGINLVENGRVEGAVGGIFRNPNDLALNMVVILPLALFAAMRPGRPLRRLTAAACALLMFGAIVASHSRSGTLGLVAMLLVTAGFTLRSRPRYVIVGVLAAAMAAPLLPASYWRRLSSITDESKDDTGSREARQTLLKESLDAFLQNPITGVGAGQFRNWNPEGRQQAWRESHDVLLQVAAELGIAGVFAFLFLVARGGLSLLATRRLLRRARGLSPPYDRRGRQARPIARQFSAAELEWFDAHTAAMAAAMAGWFVCALFASVAYNWTFYYLLALAAAPRDILLQRFAESKAVPAGRLAVRLETART